MFFIIGLGLAIVIGIMFLRLALWKKIVFASIVLGILASILLFALGGQVSGSVITRGNELWWDTTPGKEGILFLSMIVGMFLRVTWDAVDAYQRRKKQTASSSGPVFDFWDFISPAIVSLLVFQSVLSMGEGQPMSIKLALFSLQNGFFWNTIFAKLKQPNSLRSST